MFLLAIAACVAGPPQLNTVSSAAVISQKAGAPSATPAQAVGSTSLGRDSNSDTLVVAYVGETQGNLVACNCPEHPWGGLAQRVGFFRKARALHAGALTLAFDTGGFLPSGEVPLRDTPAAARRLTELLIESFERASIDAIALDRGEARFLHGLAPAHNKYWHSRALEADPPAAPRWWDWESRRVAVIALASTLSDSAVAAVSAPVRAEADVMIVLARADAVDGRRLARLSEADLVLLSRAARPPRPLHEGRSWLVGAGGHGREVGEVLLTWENGKLDLVESRVHPMSHDVAPDPWTEEQVRTLLDEEGPGWQTILHPTP